MNILVWSIALMCHAACTSFAGLFVVRCILGVCEGSITAGFMIVSGMFYTRTEQTLRVGYWCASTRFVCDCWLIFAYSLDEWDWSVVHRSSAQAITWLTLGTGMQRKSSPALSALALCISTRRVLNLGNGSDNFSFTAFLYKKRSLSCL